MKQNGKLVDEKELKEMKLILSRIQMKLDSEKKQNAMKTFEEKQDEKTAKA